MARYQSESEYARGNPQEPRTFNMLGSTLALESVIERDCSAELLLQKFNLLGLCRREVWKWESSSSLYVSAIAISMSMSLYIKWRRKKLWGYKVV